METFSERGMKIELWGFEQDRMFKIKALHIKHYVITIRYETP